MQLDAAQIRAACEASLRRLQTSYLDLYQIHWPARYTPLWGARQYDPALERADEPSITEQVWNMERHVFIPLLDNGTEYKFPPMSELPVPEPEEPSASSAMSC